MKKVDHGRGRVLFFFFRFFAPSRPPGRVSVETEGKEEISPHSTYSRISCRARRRFQRTFPDPRSSRRTGFGFSRIWDLTLIALRNPYAARLEAGRGSAKRMSTAPRCLASCSFRRRLTRESSDGVALRTRPAMRSATTRPMSRRTRASTGCSSMRRRRSSRRSLPGGAPEYAG